MTSVPMAAGYNAARLIALAAPLDALLDEPAMARAERRLRDCLGLDSTEAELLARRCVLFQRDRRLHETLILQADPDQLRSIVDAVEIEGIERLERGARGCLFVAFHYGPYSSLLWLALARAAAAGRIRPMTLLLNRQLDPNLVIPADRFEVLVAQSVLPPETFAPFDLAGHGISALKELAAVVNDGGSLLVMPDAWFVPPDSRTAVPCRIGRRTVGLPRGVDWLARRTECEVVAVWIQPDHQGHRIVMDSVGGVAAALRALGAVVGADPAPWEGWTRDQPHF